jgi:hypothetical protein
MRKCANISPYMRRLLVIYDFGTAPISLYMMKIWFSFYQCNLFYKIAKRLFPGHVEKEKFACIACIACSYKSIGVYFYGKYLEYIFTISLPLINASCLYMLCNQCLLALNLNIVLQGLRINKDLLLHLFEVIWKYYRRLSDLIWKDNSGTSPTAWSLPLAFCLEPPIALSTRPTQMA